MALTIIGALFPIVLLTAGQAAATDYGCFSNGQGEPVADSSRSHIVRIDRGSPWVDWNWRGTEYRCPKTATSDCGRAWASHTQTIATAQGYNSAVTRLLNGTTISERESFNSGVYVHSGQAVYPYTYAWYQWGRVYVQGVWKYYRAPAGNTVYCDSNNTKTEYQWYPNDVATFDGTLFTGTKGGAYYVYYY